MRAGRCAAGRDSNPTCWERVSLVKGRLTTAESGLRNQDLLRAYWEHIGGDYPKRPNGEPDIKAISNQSGINRSAFYSNKGLQSLLGSLLGRDRNVIDDDSGVRNQYRAALQRRDDRILELQQRLTEAQAESEALRDAVKDLKARLLRFRELEAILVEKGVVFD